MKRVLSCLAAAIILIGCLSGCASGNSRTNTDKKRVQIVTTIFPEYDWVTNILGENPAEADVTMLLGNGVDLHSYQSTADDILKLSTCDLFIYVGGESDIWVDDALQEAMNKDMVVINLLDVLGDSVKEEEVIEGMQDEDHEHDEGTDVDEHEGDETEYDEHVWLSLRNASIFIQKISDAIQTIDPDNAAVYKNNTSAFIAKLKELDSKYQAVVDNASFHTLLFGDRFPFRYLVDDYGLDYYAAFVGCSAETEASFETITFLSRKADELSLPAIMTIEGPDHRIAEAIRQNTKSKDQSILVLDSMQSTTAKDVQNGTSYLSIMERNLSVLEDALN